MKKLLMILVLNGLALSANATGLVCFSSDLNKEISIYEAVKLGTEKTKKISNGEMEYKKIYVTNNDWAQSEISENETGWVDHGDYYSAVAFIDSIFPASGSKMRMEGIGRINVNKADCKLEHFNSPVRKVIDNK